MTHPLYQITRTEINYGQGFRFELRNTILGCVVLIAYSTNPRIPKWLAVAQQRMNKRSVLA